jgi:hypothetical protein
MATTGIANAKKPFVRNANPQKTPNNNKKTFFFFLDGSALWTKKNDVIEAVTNMASILSKTLNVPMPYTINEVRNISAARVAAVISPENRRTSKNIINAESPVAAAHGKRAAKAFSPNNLMDNAFSQYPITGFSKYLSPLSLGTTQSPEAIISRGISA